MTTQSSSDTAGRPELETAYLKIREGFEVVPTLEQFEALEILAARLEVVVKPAQRNAVCVDEASGREIEAGLARELLELADPRRWQLDAAHVHHAQVVAAIDPHSEWRDLSPVQRRALSAWHLQYPELTYATILPVGPQVAEQRLRLHYGLQDKAQSGPSLRARQLVESAPEDMPESQVPTAPAEVMVEQPVAEPAKPAKRETGPTMASRPRAGQGLPAGLYSVADTMDDTLRGTLQSAGLQPPQDAKGFVIVDPYGASNTLTEVVLGYLEKLGTDMPPGGIKWLVQRVASYNGQSAATSLAEGDVVWFPNSATLRQWLVKMEQD